MIFLKRMKLLYILIPLIFSIFSCTTIPINKPLPDFAIIKNIEIERAQGNSDCIPVALETLFRFYGVNIDRREIRESIGRPLGTRISYMIPYIREQGFNVYTLKDKDLGKEKLKSYIIQGLPVLVLGGNQSGSPGHVVILVGYDNSKGIFYIVDPEQIGIQTFEYFDFNEWHQKQGAYGIIIIPRLFRERKENH